MQKKKKCTFCKNSTEVVLHLFSESHVHDVHVSCYWYANFDRLVKMVNSRFLSSKVK